MNAIRIAETTRAGKPALAMTWAGRSYTIEQVGVMQRTLLRALQNTAGKVALGVDSADDVQLLVQLNTKELYPAVLGAAVEVMRSDRVPESVITEMLGIGFHYQTVGLKAAKDIVRQLDAKGARRGA